MSLLFRSGAAALIVVALTSAACVKAKPPTDTGDDSTAANPIGPTTPGDPTSGTPDQTSPLAYNQDLKAVFASDCVSCHGSGRADGGYRMTTYAQVMTDVRPGNAYSILVEVTQRNGSMYRYFSGSATTRQAKSDAVRTWIVTYSAQENR
jgi:mono/diheme cytochrome c family protein